jgi:hypothetical protein
MNLQSCSRDTDHEVSVRQTGANQNVLNPSDKINEPRFIFEHAYKFAIIKKTQRNSEQI